MNYDDINDKPTETLLRITNIEKEIAIFRAELVTFLQMIHSAHASYVVDVEKIHREADKRVLKGVQNAIEQNRLSPKQVYNILESQFNRLLRKTEQDAISDRVKTFLQLKEELIKK